MGAVFTPKRYKLSVGDFHKLGAAGILGEDARVELIDGELIETAPIGPRTPLRWIRWRNCWPRKLPVASASPRKTRSRSRRDRSLSRI